MEAAPRRLARTRGPGLHAGRPRDAIQPDRGSGSVPSLKMSRYSAYEKTRFRRRPVTSCTIPRRSNSQQRRVHSRRRQAGLLDQAWRSHVRHLLQHVVQAQGRSAAHPLPRKPFAILLEQGDDACRRLERLVGGGRHAVQEELQPGLPRAALPHLLQQTVVILAMRFQIEAEIQQRLAQHVIGAQVQRDQQAPGTAVAV